MDTLTVEQNRAIAEAQSLLQMHLREFTKDEAERQMLTRHAVFGLLACELDIDL